MPHNLTSIITTISLSGSHILLIITIDCTNTLTNTNTVTNGLENDL